MEPALHILREGTAAMTGANIAEVFDVAIRRKGLSRARVADVVEPLFEGSVAPLAVDAALARRAGETRAEHYHRTNRPISLADAVLLAAAESGDKIATADSDVLAVAAELGIETIQLPRSR
jgi:predicted nucleic acid-binding protein